MSQTATVSLLTGMPSAYDVQSFQLPPFATTIANGFCRVHKVWKSWVRSREMTSSTMRMVEFLSGYLIEQTSAHSSRARIIAKVIQIARYTMECMKQQQIFARYVHYISDAWHDRSEPRQYTSCNKLSWLRPITRHRIARSINRSLTTFVDLIKLSGRALWELFQLSMRWMSLMNALTDDPIAQREALEDIALNSSALLRELAANKENIKRYLEMFGKEHKLSLITSAINRTLDFVDFVQQIPESCRQLVESAREIHRKTVKRIKHSYHIIKERLLSFFKSTLSIAHRVIEWIGRQGNPSGLVIKE